MKDLKQNQILAISQPPLKSQNRDLALSKNPFLLPPVLQTLFKYLPIHDVKNSRLVSKQWAEQGFGALRERSYISLLEENRRLQFLKSPIRNRFFHFSFTLGDWSDSSSVIFQGLRPSTIFLQLLGQRDSHFISKFTNVCSTQYSTLTRLGLSFPYRWNIDDSVDSEDSETSDAEDVFTPELCQIPESLQHVKLPKLEGLSIKQLHNIGGFLYQNRTYDKIPDGHPLKLVISLLKGNAPKLRFLQMVLDSELASEEFWNALGYARNLEELHLPKLDYEPRLFQILQQTLRSLPKLRNLSIVLWSTSLPEDFNEDTGRQVGLLLETVCEKVRVLELKINDRIADRFTFHDIPVMEKVEIFRVNNKMDLIVPEKFPRLKEVQKEVHSNFSSGILDYWGDREPHFGVTDVTIDLEGILYFGFLGEEFEEFLNGLVEKFPNCVNFTFDSLENVDPQLNVCTETVEAVTRIFQYKMKSFRVADYYVLWEHPWAQMLNFFDYDDEEPAPYPFPLFVMDDVNDFACLKRPLEVLDLNPGAWPTRTRWRTFSSFSEPIFDELWLYSIRYFEKLRVLKLIWAENILSALGLEDPNVLPNLEHLEFIGNLCVNRYVRARVRILRPKLYLRQHRECQCDAEDWWYMNDPKSLDVFRKLFRISTYWTDVKKRKIRKQWALMYTYGSIV